MIRHELVKLPDLMSHLATTMSHLALKMSRVVPSEVDVGHGATSDDDSNYVGLQLFSARF